MRRLITIAMFCVFAAACGSTSTTSPTQTPTTTTPTPSTFTLSGQVTSTSGAAINGARVTIADGQNAGKSTTTDASGNYAIASLAVSGFTVNFSATNFFATAKSVTLTSNQTLSAQLTPTPLFTASGSGNTVFDMPTTVSRIHITGTYTGTFESNFIVTIGGRLVVNVIIGPYNGGSSVSDGIYLTTGGTVAITNTTNVSWTFTEVRP